MMVETMDTKAVKLAGQLAWKMVVPMDTTVAMLAVRLVDWLEYCWAVC